MTIGDGTIITFIRARLDEDEQRCRKVIDDTQTNRGVFTGSLEARVLCEIMPRTFVMENVPGIESMVTPEGIPVLDAFALAVSDGGYDEYEALRRALGATGSKAAVRRKRRRDGEAQEPTLEQITEADQLDLFAEGDGDG